jgi:hypothetical protein
VGNRKGRRRESESYTFIRGKHAEYAVDRINWRKQAALKVEEYLDYSSLSHSGLTEQLAYEDFTAAQATYGVDHTRCPDFRSSGRLRALTLRAHCGGLGFVYHQHRPEERAYVRRNTPPEGGHDVVTQVPVDPHPDGAASPRRTGGHTHGGARSLLRSA